MQPLATVAARSKYVLGVAFTPDGRLLLAGGWDGTVEIWATESLAPIAILTGHTQSVNSLALSADGTMLATGSTDCSVRLWDLRSMSGLRSMTDRKKTVAGTAISSDGNLVAAAAYGGRAAVWTADGQPVTAFPASKQHLTAVAFAREGKALVAGGIGDEAGVWSVPAAAVSARLPGHGAAVIGIAPIPAQERVLTLGHNGILRLWDAATWAAVSDHQLTLPSSPRSLAVAPEGDRVAVATEGRIFVYSLPGMETRHDIPVPTKAVNGIAFTPRRQGMLAVGAADGMVRIWRTV